MHYRIDDRFRVRHLTDRGIGIIGNPLRRPERKKGRQDVAFQYNVKNDDHPAFATGTQTEGSNSCGAKPSPDMEKGASGRQWGSGNAGRLVSISAAQFGYPTNGKDLEVAARIIWRKWMRTTQFHNHLQ